MSDKVFLVGAGPGDPELLTLKAAKAIARADVILCDELVHEDVLLHARPGARVVRVGKRGGRASTSQRFIERLMVSEARRGRLVVRLKGGDPMIFGRGGEECEALRAADLDFEVINGITSGLAAATSVGIPLTHRELCHGAILITGTTEDWNALARTGLPLVIYMGVARCEAIVAALLAAGMARTTPAAAIANATRREQRSIATTLECLPDDLRRADLGSPAILIVGRTAALASGAGLEAPQEIEQHVGG